MAIAKKLNPTQLEILNLFSRELDENDLQEIKRMITKYLSKKAAKQANDVWDKKGWTKAKMDDLSQTHMRTPYSK